MMKYLYLILALMTLLSACSIEQDKAKQGPNGSWWLGGLDGGVYVKISDDKPNDRNYRGVIYNDWDKTIWYKGAFVLVGNINFIPENKQLE